MTADWARLAARGASARSHPHRQRGAASTASSTTSPRSRPARSSGSERWRQCSSGHEVVARRRRGTGRREPWSKSWDQAGRCTGCGDARAEVDLRTLNVEQALFSLLQERTRARAGAAAVRKNATAICWVWPSGMFMYVVSLRSALVAVERDAHAQRAWSFGENRRGIERVVRRRELVPRLGKGSKWLWSAIDHECRLLL